MFGGASLVQLLLFNASLVHCFLGAIYFWCIVSNIAKACYRRGASTLLGCLMETKNGEICVSLKISDTG